ncbi:MAG: hypothetical protein H6521_09330 [Mycolicibacterium sp.]|nr:hypothetical protein [Mycobacterium sp.]MCB9409576.1 hypothetical protein [Mycolicibacterium sp.]
MDLSVPVTTLATVDTANDSLTSALAKARIPSANHAFIRKLTDAVGIAGYRVVEASETYVAATRCDGLRDLRIHSGYTIGFTTEEEARRVGAGADTIRKSYKLTSTWLVSHPQHGDLGLRGKSSPSARREAAMCPKGCGYPLSLTGVCDHCD